MKNNSEKFKINMNFNKIKGFGEWVEYKYPNLIIKYYNWEEIIPYIAKLEILKQFLREVYGTYVSFTPDYDGKEGVGKYVIKIGNREKVIISIIVDNDCYIEVFEIALKEGLNYNNLYV